jgi:hypothetical protein
MLTLISVEFNIRRYYRGINKLQFVYFDYIRNISLIMADFNNIDRKLEHRKNQEQIPKMLKR